MRAPGTYDTRSLSPTSEAPDITDLMPVSTARLHALAPQLSPLGVRPYTSRVARLGCGGLLPTGRRGRLSLGVVNPVPPTLARGQVCPPMTRDGEAPYGFEYQVHVIPSTHPPRQPPDVTSGLSLMHSGGELYVEARTVYVLPRYVLAS